MMRSHKLVLAALAMGLAGCSSTGEGVGLDNGYYSLVRVRDVHVGDGSMAVTAPRPWNRTRTSVFSFEDVRQVEDWTLNGPLLDNISFITGLRNNRRIIYQRRTEDQQVPRFRSDMSAPEITAMLETFFRVRAGSVDLRVLRRESPSDPPSIVVKSTVPFELELCWQGGKQIYKIVAEPVPDK
jgi:hypothetical protein